MTNALLSLLILAIPQSSQAPAAPEIDPARLADAQAERARHEARPPRQPGPGGADGLQVDAAQVAASSLGVGELPGGGAEASGPSWHARWEDGRARFAGLGGPRETPAAVLELELLEIAREGSQPFGLALDTRAKAHVEGGGDAHSARVSRAVAGDLSERWDLLPEGVELSYELHTLPPGEGDLVVRLAATTDLRARFGLGQPGEGLSFAGPAGSGVEVGAVTGIDAGGATCDGRLAWNGAQLELRLPADFVDDAALPLVVDPFLSSFLRLSGTYPTDAAPDPAWDEDTQTWGVAFWRRRADVCGGQLAFNVLLQRLHPSGALKGPAILLGSGSQTEFRPAWWKDSTLDVADVNGRDAFLVVVANLDVCYVGDPRAIHLMRVDAATGQHDMGATVTQEVDWDIMGLELGTDPLPGYPNVLVTWIERNGTQAQVGSMLARLPSDGGIELTTPETLSSWGDIKSVAVSPSGGTAGRWLVAWDAWDAGSIRARTVAWTGAPEAPETNVVYGGRDPRVAGGGTEFVLQYYTSFSDVTALYAYRFHASGGTVHVGPGGLVEYSDGTVGETHDITALGDRYVSAWSEATGAAWFHGFPYTSFDFHVRTLDFDSWPIEIESEDFSSWILTTIYFGLGRFRLGSMSESKSYASDDDQVLGGWSPLPEAGGVYTVRIWN